MYWQGKRYKIKAETGSAGLQRSGSQKEQGESREEHVGDELERAQAA